MPPCELLAPPEGLAHVPPAFLGEVLEAHGEIGGQALRQPEQGEPVVGIDRLADVAAEGGAGLFGPGAVPAGEFDQRIAVALVFGSCDGAQRRGGRGRIPAALGQQTP